jgi:hypothetical protein
MSILTSDGRCYITSQHQSSMQLTELVPDHPIKGRRKVKDVTLTKALLPTNTTGTECHIMLCCVVLYCVVLYIYSVVKYSIV